MAERRKTRGAGLTRDKVLAVALELADAEGLEALSFRRLAGRLDVTPMALYRYVASKEALLDGMGDRVLGELELSQAQDDDWREQLRAAARSFRSSLLAHPAVLPIFLSRPLFTPAARDAAETLLGSFMRAGFARERAVLLYQQFVRLVLALVLLETGGGAQSDAKRREQARMARMTLEALPRTRYPNLVEAAPHLAAARDPEVAFEAGLDLLLAGIEQLQASSTS